MPSCDTCRCSTRRVALRQCGKRLRTRACVQSRLLTRFVHSVHTSCDSKRPSSSSSLLLANASSGGETQSPFQYVFGSRANARLCVCRALRAALLALRSATLCPKPPAAQRHPLRLAALPTLPKVAQLLHSRRKPNVRPASATHSTLMQAGLARARRHTAHNLLRTSLRQPPRSKDCARACNFGAKIL